MSTRELYERLGVEPTASSDEIKKAYRVLALRHHPDKGGDEDTFKKITEAYHILSDPEKRAKYDRFGMEGTNGMPDFHEMMRGVFGGEFPFQGFGFPDGRYRSVSEAPATVIRLSVALEEIAAGCRRTVRWSRKKLRETSVRQKCTTCAGRGRVVQNISMGFMHTSQVRSCHACNGTGFDHNTLYNVVEEEASVGIDKGTPDGTVLKIGRKGDEIPCGETGEVTVVVTYAPHDIFRVQNRHDLHTTLKINLVEALTGIERTIKVPDGRVLRISIKDRVIQGGDTARITGGGLPVFRRPFLSGDLFVRFTCVFPESVPSKYARYLTVILGQKATPPPTDSENGDPVEVREWMSSDVSCKESREEEEEGAIPEGAERIECRQQ
jgi:DnaJ family protein A protein 2